MGALSILQLPKLHEFRIFNWLSPICLLKSLSFYCLVINFILGSEVQYKLKVTKKKSYHTALDTLRDNRRCTPEKNQTLSCKYLYPLHTCLFTDQSIYITYCKNLSPTSTHVDLSLRNSADWLNQSMAPSCRGFMAFPEAQQLHAAAKHRTEPWLSSDVALALCTSSFPESSTT